MDQLSREDEDRQDGTAEVDGSAWDCMANWTQAERDYWFMGPFDGGIEMRHRAATRDARTSLQA